MASTSRRPFRVTRPLLGAVCALAVLTALGAPPAGPASARVAAPVRVAAAVTPGPYLTLLFSRTELGANDTPLPGCALDTRGIARLDTVVAPWLAARGKAGTGSLQTGLLQDTALTCLHFHRSVTTSWAIANTLATRYTWRFVSHSATYPLDFHTLTGTQKQAETCGSEQTIRAHGLPGSNGLFAYPNNKWTVADQTVYVAPCFAFGRQYAISAGITTITDARTPPYFQHTATVSGGRCNVPTLSCWTVAQLSGSTQHYDVPSTFISRIGSLVPGQWYTLQNYVLVTGTNPAYRSNPIRWDCRSTDPNQHWTNDSEYYCWTDFQAIVRSVPARVTVTHPATVAHAFGRPGF